MASERSVRAQRLKQIGRWGAAFALGACSPALAPNTAADTRTQAPVTSADVTSSQDVASPDVTSQDMTSQDMTSPNVTSANVSDSATRRPPLCATSPGAAPQVAFDEPNRGCDVPVGNWDQVLASARAKLSFGFGPECTQDELEGCIQRCAADDLDACIGLVNARLRGSRVELEQPLERIAIACAREHASACNAVANMWGHGLGNARVDRARAFTYRKQACRLGHGAACAPLGHMYKNGGDGIEQDAERGYELLKQGCQMGSASACNDFGWSMVSDGWGKARSPERALRLFVFSCSQGSAHGCGSLGEALEKGWGVTPDRVQARLFWSLQCEHHKQPEACAAVERLSDEPAPRE